MVLIYAQLDAQGRAVAVTQAAGPLNVPGVVPLESFDETVLGKTWDAEAGAWLAAPVVPVRRLITGLAFRRRFTPDERVAVEWAAVDRATDTEAQRMQAAALRSQIKDQEAALYIDLDDVEIQSGVMALEAAGIVGAGRAAVILGAEIQDHERPL
ncbi:hypothetical protein [Diaphorobacter nitroreducens]|uniref:hypothetical protein n=1 Tax=Diaphorobacter nitroreducens TaxID=164759 RepID=UPI00289A9E89|nr:hypothetical protein [Diaphorobacter nitroreducens]